MDVRGGARHAAERLEVTANQHVVVGKVFFQLHVYLPVSYTHLDVYKRQGSNSAFGDFTHAYLHNTERKATATVNGYPSDYGSRCV